MIKRLLGEELYAAVSKVADIRALTEIRVRLAHPIAVKIGLRRIALATVATQQMLDGIVARATNFSLYSKQEELLSGFLHYDGGIRLGVGGRGVTDGGKLKSFASITSLNIRLPHEVRGCSDKIKSILSPFENTLIVSPPYAGKTTLIRDTVRVLGAKYDVAVIDEREELSGGGSFDLGSYADIIENVPKNLVVENVIRSMSPEIVVFDELSPIRDLSVVESVSNAGIKLLASMHSDSLEGLSRAYPQMVSYFKYGVLLSNKVAVGSIDSIVRFKSG